MLMSMTGLGPILLAVTGGLPGATAVQELSRPAVTVRPEGIMGRYVKNIVEQWLLTAPHVRCDLNLKSLKWCYSTEKSIVYIHINPAAKSTFNAK